MILSYNTTKKQDDNFSDDSNEEEEFMKIEDIMKKNIKKEPEKETINTVEINQEIKKEEIKSPEKKDTQPKSIEKNDKEKEGDSALGSFFSWQDNNISLGTSGQISKIDFANQSSSLHSQIMIDQKKENGNSSLSKDFFTRPEEFLQQQQQPDVIQFLEQDSTKKHNTFLGISEIPSQDPINLEDKIIDVSLDRSSLYQKNKNFVLKAEYNQNKSTSLTQSLHQQGNSILPDKVNHSSVGETLNTLSKEKSQNPTAPIISSAPIIPQLNISQSSQGNSNSINQILSQTPDNLNFLNSIQSINISQPLSNSNIAKSPKSYNFQQQTNPIYSTTTSQQGLSSQLNQLKIVKSPLNMPIQMPSSLPQDVNLANQLNHLNIGQSQPLGIQNLNLQNSQTKDLNDPRMLAERFSSLSIHQKYPSVQQPQTNINYSIKDIISNCYLLSKEQFGCRLLQKILDENPNLASEVFYPKIKSKFVELSCELFGNYFIQKIIEYLPIPDIEEIVQRIIPNAFRNMSFNQHGTRVIQKLLVSIKDHEVLINFFVLLLQPHLADFIFDQNANHIISNFVSCTTSSKNEFIIEFIKANIVDIATQKHSCCALQKCIQFSNPLQSKVLLLGIAENSYKMFNNQYGNYVIQYVVSLCNYEINNLLVLNLLKDFQGYASMKYSSSIIEKCMQFSDKDTIKLIFDKLVNDYNLVKAILFDMYGNYVIQRALSIAKEPYKTRLFEIIGPLLEGLKILSYGNKLYSKLITNYPDLIKYIPIPDIQKPNLGSMQLMGNQLGIVSGINQNNLTLGGQNSGSLSLGNQNQLNLRGQGNLNIGQGNIGLTGQNNLGLSQNQLNLVNQGNLGIGSQNNLNLGNVNYFGNFNLPYNQQMSGRFEYSENMGIRKGSNHSSKNVLNSQLNNQYNNQINYQTLLNSQSNSNLQSQSQNPKLFYGNGYFMQNY